MDRVQRSGLITLAVLLLTAVGAHFIGSRPGSEASIPERKVAQDPAAWEGVQFLPPEQRELFVGAADFVRPPVRHPLTGVGERDILSGVDDGPEPPILQAENASASNGEGAGGRLLNIDLDPQGAGDAPVQRSNDLPAGPGTGRDRTRTARVRENDNLTKIAKRELGDGDRWREIAELNEIPKPYHVRVGELLYLPGEKAAQPAASPAPTPVNAGAGNTPSSAGNELRKVASYKVKPGDTPGEISQAVYGTSKHWKSILSANGIADARDLRAGTILKIPSRKE
ncbi:MAG: hypothetical protein CMJ94_02100 [Planctomycetes bacterium]|nr:hypothetical protein [Planctomycetota bacterium]